MALSRDEILAAQDMVPVRVDVPEWGGETFVRPMTPTERLQWESAQDALADSDRIPAFLARVLCDAGGKRIFEDGDGPALTNHAWHVLYRLWREAIKVNGLAHEVTGGAATKDRP